MNETDKVILVATLKGLAHAVLVPLLIMALVNHFFSGNFGGVAALSYLIVPATVYAMATDKDISKLVFKYTLGTILSFVLVIAFLVLMSAFS